MRSRIYLLALGYLIRSLALPSQNPVMNYRNLYLKSDVHKDYLGRHFELLIDAPEFKSTLVLPAGQSESSS